MCTVKRVRGCDIVVNDIGRSLRVGGCASRGVVDAMPGEAVGKSAAVGLEADWWVERHPSVLL